MEIWALLLSDTMLLCLSEPNDSQLAKKSVKLSLLGEIEELEPAVLNPIEQLPVSEPLFVEENHSELLE